MQLLAVSSIVGGTDSVPPAIGALHLDSGHAIAVSGTRFEITGSDGAVLPQAALVGAVLAVKDAAGRNAQIRIDAAISDPRDPDGDVTLYRLATRDAADGEWRNPCTPGPDGLALGFPVSGIWTERGAHEREPNAFSLTCTSGAVGKCVRMGYHYWEPGADGAPMWELHEACTRLLRADYCGDGRSHTRDGTVVNVYDRFGIQRPDPEPSRFEATWAADGAVCVRRTRLPDIATLGEVVRGCPERLAARSDEACNGAERLDDARALLANHS